MTQELFPTPDGPEDTIIECEGCQNILYNRYNSTQEVCPCPICGCLNRTTVAKGEKIFGRIVLKSPPMSMNRESVERGRISLPGLPEQVQEALLWLQENQWSFGFTIEKDDKKDK
ncbi:MAG: hypothetical protein HQL32_16235 [Planctomycetes bacterium]|nr:hypothetical protein [Planctomycetota bacterium]